MPQDLLLPTLAGVAAGLVVALVVDRRLHPPPAARGRRASSATARSEAERLRAEAARDAEAAKQRDAGGAPRWRRSSSGRSSTARCSAGGRSGSGCERRADERSRAQERKLEEVEARERTLAKREEALGAAGAGAPRRARARPTGWRRSSASSWSGSPGSPRRTPGGRSSSAWRTRRGARRQALARDIKEQAKRGADREARRIISMAIQRLAAEHTAETTVAAVSLPNDEMKGRIIGREGRNIRAFETATGVDVIIDDTPDTVIVCCFDPIRREVARRSLEALIQDGRIHPGRIEEVVHKAQKELETPAGRAGRAGGLRHRRSTGSIPS